MDDDNNNDDNSCNDKNDNDSFTNFIITTIIIIFVSAIVSIIISSISIITNIVTIPYISCYKLDHEVIMEHKCGNHFKFRFNGYDNLTMPSIRNE